MCLRHVFASNGLNFSVLHPLIFLVFRVFVPYQPKAYSPGIPHLYPTSPLVNSRLIQFSSVFHVALASPGSTMLPAPRRMSAYCMSLFLRGVVSSGTLWRLIAPESTDPGLKIYAQKKREPKIAQVEVLLTFHWIWAWKSLKSFLPCLEGHNKDDVHCITTLRRFTQPCTDDDCIDYSVIILFWHFFSFLCHSCFLDHLFYLYYLFVRETTSLFVILLIFCQFAVFVKPCSCDNSIQTSTNKHRQCLCSSVFLRCSSPETRLQDLSIGQLEWNRGTDRICPRDMRTGLWRRPPTLHDGEAGSHQISILESSQWWYLDREVCQE